MYMQMANKPCNLNPWLADKDKLGCNMVAREMPTWFDKWQA